MSEYEKLGAFYLGKEYDMPSRTRQENLVLYDSKDLTTHGVIIGMTGSGKTGLGIALLEEALIDNIPIIAIDPKGDLGNLLLLFEDLDAASFEEFKDAAEKAYLENGGSFNALLISLLTSDSFIYRKQLD